MHHPGVRPLGLEELPHAAVVKLGDWAPAAIHRREIVLIVTGVVEGLDNVESVERWARTYGNRVVEETGDERLRLGAVRDTSVDGVSSGVEAI
jgi:hypothetical protein